MIPAGKLLLTVAFSVTAFALWKFFQFVYRECTSPLRNLRGPKGSSWIYGNMRDNPNAEISVLHEEWANQYGSTLAYKDFFYVNRLLTTDTRAIHHVLTHTSDYQKPFQLRYKLSQTFGEGLLFAEGAQHRQQRHTLNPAFGPAQIRALTDIFIDKAVRLRDVWSSEIAKDPTGMSIGVRLDVVQWLNRMTLDVIGLAGFNYNFDALNSNEKPNELNEAFATLAAAGQTSSILPILKAWIPPLRLLPSEHAHRVQIAQHTTARIGKELLSGAKAAARASMTEKGEIEKSSLHGRDLLSLLVKANMATDIPESQRLSDEDVLAQVPTFLIAGHETTSTATTWALYAMTRAPEIQTKLREELLFVDTETPSMDELMALPYLDAVVRETLRVHSPVPSGTRIAMKDDVLPVEKPFKDKYGVVQHYIKISKGDRVVIPILAMNRSEELWGSDAGEFKPERWTKALLFTLVRAFEFELAVPASEIDKRTAIVQRPVLRSDPKSRPQLPLLVRPHKRM